MTVNRVNQEVILRAMLEAFLSKNDIYCPKLIWVEEGAIFLEQ